MMYNVPLVVGNGTGVSGGIKLDQAGVSKVSQRALSRQLGKRTRDRKKRGALTGKHFVLFLRSIYLGLKAEIDESQ